MVVGRAALSGSKTFLSAPAAHTGTVILNGVRNPVRAAVRGLLNTTRRSLSVLRGSLSQCRRVTRRPAQRALAARGIVRRVANWPLSLLPPTGACRSAGSTYRNDPPHTRKEAVIPAQAGIRMNEGEESPGGTRSVASVFLCEGEGHDGA